MISDHPTQDQLTIGSNDQVSRNFSAVGQEYLCGLEIIPVGCCAKPEFDSQLSSTFKHGQLEVGTVHVPKRRPILGNHLLAEVIPPAEHFVALVGKNGKNFRTGCNFFEPFFQAPTVQQSRRIWSELQASAYLMKICNVSISTRSLPVRSRYLPLPIVVPTRVPELRVR